MKCQNKVPQYIPRGYSYKEVWSPCGATGIHGEWLICEECESNPNIVAERERIEANCEADNAWLKSAGWGEM